jgi:hypothetical protein
MLTLTYLYIYIYTNDENVMINYFSCGFWFGWKINYLISRGIYHAYVILNDNWTAILLFREKKKKEKKKGTRV